MSAGRGRGNNMRQSQDNNRRELRRPMGGDEELARGMGRMDPFGNGGGQFGGQFGGGGGRYMQNQFDPPRPAPNADGWSSGDDFLAWSNDQQDHYGNNSNYGQHHGRTPAQSRLQYNQQQYQQQQQRQQQQQWNQAAQYQQWNLGASEFVPKSNLSVSASEFVPRSMARNTSQWAYQQQQPGMPDYSGSGGQYSGYQGGNYGQGGGYQGGSSGGQSGQGGQAAMGSNLYDPSEVLSDAIATIVFMPSKFERTTMHLANKFNSSLEDSATMSSLVDSLVEQCLKEEQFLNLAGRFCSYLAQNVTIQAEEGVNLKSLTMQKLGNLTNQSASLLSTQEKRVHALLTIMVDMYLHLGVTSTEKSWKSHDANLATNIDALLTVLFNNGSESNLKVAAQKLKLCGKTLEGEEKFANITGSQIDEEKSWSEHPAPNMDKLMALVSTAAEKASPELQKDLKSLVETRTNEKWASAEAENAKAREESAKSLEKPAPRKSAAIRIEPDPNDARTHHAPVVTAPRVASHEKAKGQELTDEELKFMADAIGEDGGSDHEDIEESDGGMTEDIADAYEQFLAEQNGGK